MNGPRLGVAAAWMVGLVVLSVGLDRDERRLSAEGRALVNADLAAAARWRALAGRGELAAGEPDEITRLKVAGEVLGWSQVLSTGEDDLKHGMELVLAAPPPDRETAEIALMMVTGAPSTGRVLDHALEEAPLAASFWRGAPPVGGGAVATGLDPLGAPMEGGEASAALPGPPWGEALIAGALVQQAVSMPGRPRPTPTALGALRAEIAAPLRRWCFEDDRRLDLSVCAPPVPEELPVALDVLRDPAAPTDGAVLWAAMVVETSTLLTLAQSPAEAPHVRLRAALAWCRAAPRAEVTPTLGDWITAGEPAFLPLIAALELLRLGEPAMVPALRAAAPHLGPSEALTVGWVADLLEDPTRY